MIITGYDQKGAGLRRLVTGLVLVLAVVFLAAAIFVILFHGSADERVYAARVAELFRSSVSGANNTLSKIREDTVPLSDYPETADDFSPVRVTTSMYLKHWRTIKVDLDLHLTTPDLLEMSRQCPRVHLVARSTAPFDERIAATMTSDPDAREKLVGIFQGDFADFYRQVVSAETQTFPMANDIYHLSLGPLPDGDEQLPQPPLVTVLFASGGRGRVYRFAPFKLGGAYREDSLRQACSYVTHLSGHVDDAARRLAQGHPEELHLDNVRLFLRMGIVNHQLELTNEDVWQDRAALHWVGEDILPRFETEYREYKKRGVAIGVDFLGGIRDLPWWTWLAAAVSRKYRIGRQGLGPQQIIIGLAREAAGNKTVLERYYPVLKEEDFSTLRSTVRTVLIPEKAVHTKAMIFDYIITALKKGPFSNPRFRLSINTIPFISNKKTAREYALYLLAFRLSMFPELSSYAAEMVSTSGHPLYVSLHTYASMFGIKPYLPGLFYCSFRDNRLKRTVYAKFFF